MFETKVKTDPRFSQSMAIAASLAHDQVEMAAEIVKARSDLLGGPALPEIVAAIAQLIATNFAARNKTKFG